MREDEELSKKIFTDFLRENLPFSNLLWDEGNEPPDFYLTLDSKKFAVEVTSLMEIINLGDKQLPMVAIRSFLQQFQKEVAQDALENDVLKGAYLVTFSEPIKNFHEVRDVIKEGILSFASVTKNLEAPQETNWFIRNRNRQKCSIVKVHNEQDKILIMPPIRAKWESEEEKDLKQLIAKQIRTKTTKLSKISEPKILILLDRYLFDDYENTRRQGYIDFVSKIENIDFYDLVFLVYGTSGFILYSQWENA